MDPQERFLEARDRAHPCETVRIHCGRRLAPAILIPVAGPRFPPGAGTRTARAFNHGFRLRVRAFGRIAGIAGFLLALRGAGEGFLKIDGLDSPCHRLLKLIREPLMVAVAGLARLR